jgi:hypothetical protein
MVLLAIIGLGVATAVVAFTRSGDIAVALVVGITVDSAAALPLALTRPVLALTRPPDSTAVVASTVALADMAVWAVATLAGTGDPHFALLRLLQDDEPEPLGTGGGCASRNVTDDRAELIALSLSTALAKWRSGPDPEELRKILLRLLVALAARA